MDRSGAGDNGNAARRVESATGTPVPSGVAQEGGGGGYHCSTAAGYPKLVSTLEILAVEQVG